MTDWTVETLVHAIATRKISPVEATRECLNRIERLDGKIHAFITVDADGALAAARALEAELAAGLSRGPRARLEIGFRISAHDYLQALRLRARFTREFIREVFGEVDALVLPAIPEPAPALATAKAGTVDDVVGRMGRFSRLTRPFNGLGLPALAVPCGLSSDGRPLALQIVGRAFDEATVLRVGHAYQRVTAWHLEPPRFSGRGGSVIG